MSLNKKKKNSLIQLKGKVTSIGVSKGSKSEHNALNLETESGSYILRRVGGNPFSDPVLKKFTGKNIIAEGMITDQIFFAHDIKEQDKKRS